MPLLQDYLERHAPSRPEIRVGLETVIAAQRAGRDTDYQSFVKSWTKLQAQGFKRRFLLALAQLAPTPTEETVPTHAEK